jgi:hypothetical protein
MYTDFLGLRWKQLFLEGFEANNDRSDIVECFMFEGIVKNIFKWFSCKGMYSTFFLGFPNRLTYVFIR